MLSTAYQILTMMKFDPQIEYIARDIAILCRYCKDSAYMVQLLQRLCDYLCRRRRTMTHSWVLVHDYPCTIWLKMENYGEDVEWKGAIRTTPLIWIPYFCIISKCMHCMSLGTGNATLMKSPLLLCSAVCTILSFSSCCSTLLRCV